MNSAATIDPNITMRELLEQFPGAQRALFRRIILAVAAVAGSARTKRSPAFARATKISNVDEVVEHILASHEADRAMQIEPRELVGPPRGWRNSSPARHSDAGRIRRGEAAGRASLHPGIDAGNPGQMVARPISSSFTITKARAAWTQRRISKGTDSKMSRVCAAESTPGARKSIQIAPLSSGMTTMSDDLEKRIEAAVKNPQNLGEMKNADAIGTVGSRRLRRHAADVGEVQGRGRPQGDRSRDLSNLRLPDRDCGRERCDRNARGQNRRGSACRCRAKIWRRRSARCRR